MLKITDNGTPEVKQDARAKLIGKWKEKRLLGNRCVSIIIGGAQSSEELKMWIWEVFGCHVIDGYGTSETGAIATNSEVSESSNLQLIDVPEMGYLTSDTPYPRGEIVAFTKRLTPGYYNDPDATKEAFIEIGERRYFRTGDIGTLIDGKLKVIDRKNALFKLANGAFVAPAPLEMLFEQSSLIKQALVFGGPGDRSITVVVVLTDIGVKICSQETTAPATKARDLNPQPIIKECARLALEAGRKEYEVPRLAILSTVEWTVENGCLTSSLKLCRPVLLKKFSIDVCNLLDGKGRCTEVGHSDDESINSPSTPALGTKERFGLSSGLEQLLRETIPSLAFVDAAMPNADRTLYSLGVDSLALAVLRSALNSRFAIDIPLTRLAGTKLLDLNTAVLGGGVVSLPDEEDSPRSLEAEADSVRKYWHTSSIKGNELYISDTSQMKDGFANTIVGDSCTKKNIVLLTGATGFVGAFLLNELLQKENDLNVVCLVRAKNNDSATERVLSALQRYSLQCNHGRWSAVAGDISKEKLGISKFDWNNLVHSIHSVYHAGAIVNAALPLAAIRAANISGTKNIVELCVVTNAVLHYISTASVLAGSGVVNETFKVPTPEKHSTAYAKSKWVAEQIVGYGVSELGLHARIYRLGTMSCHSTTGVCNPNDTFTRIIEGIVALKAFSDDNDSILPRGFYLTPIDWSVKALCNISLRPIEELRKAWYNGKQGETDLVEVVHILSNDFLPISTAFNAILKYGVPLTKLSAAEFKDKLATMVETNAMYTFRDIFKGAAVRNNNVFLLSTSKTLSFNDRCLVVGDGTILKMLSYLDTHNKLGVFNK